jgi:hypothetical protein
MLFCDIFFFMTISQTRLLPAVFCASIASLLALGTASAAHAGAGTPYATIQIKNNFSSSLAGAPKYFGQSVTDAQVWLNLHADPGNLTYTDATTHASTPFTLNQWVQLSQIDGGILNAHVGSGNAVMYAVIYDVQPPATQPPELVPVPTCADNFSGLAYAMFEWDFHVPPYETVDISNADQFSFTSRFTVTNSSGIVGRTGFNGSASSQAILTDLKTNYGGTGICEYPGGANFLSHYPLSPGGCSLPTGNDTPPYACNGLPSDYLTRPCAQSGKMSQQITVTTNIAAVDTANAYRWVGSSKVQTSSIPGSYVNVLQGFGKSYEPYLTALFNSAQNTAGYYVDYSGGWIPGPGSSVKGISYIFKVTQGASGIGHGYEISDIRLDTRQSGDSTSNLSKVNRRLGTDCPGTLNILANGEPILRPTAGCQYDGTFPAFNNYGNWTDATLVNGAAVFGCNGSFLVGPVIMPSPNFTDPNGYTEDLIALIQGQSSAMINFGLITPNWNPQKGDQGTNFLFADANQENWQTNHLFRAGPGNDDVWTKTLWTYQDLSLIPNSTSVYCRPLYLNTYGDRLSQMSPGQSIKQNDTILWELGVPMSSPACPADFQDSGVVDGPDLSTLLNAWGQCSGTCVADLNNDNAVDGADLAILLNAWGPCPV